jgi:hypothetical protein
MEPFRMIQRIVQIPSSRQARPWKEPARRGGSAR